MGERSETSRKANGVSSGDWTMRGHPHALKKADALIKSDVNLQGIAYEQMMVFKLKTSMIKEQQDVGCSHKLALREIFMILCKKTSSEIENWVILQEKALRIVVSRLRWS
ncbi:hypothetical protein TNIN_318011 [Trichonephila inaurata madagascariensis]|uniref:Uncharacterized protein n=1 Tax=Trichonephila inaurata madagascariensis TaxID=2747483 RepID=A0A8X7CNK9_9ARAC|nr:hypothetical protein TNIN_318011 [Trichonephila inaurata madagascariensis]